MANYDPNTERFSDVPGSEDNILDILDDLSLLEDYTEFSEDPALFDESELTQDTQTAPASQTDHSSYVESAPASPGKPRSSWLKWMLITLIVICVLLAGAVAAFYFMVVKPEQDALAAAEALRLEREATETISMFVTPDTIRDLEVYPNLKSVDFLDSTCYAEIAVYQKKHPKVDALYSVNLGSRKVENTVQELTLDAADFAFDTLKENLKYLTSLTAVTFRETAMTADAIAELRETCPEISFTYTVNILGQVVDESVEELDLSSLKSDQVDVIADKLALLPHVAFVELMKDDVSHLSVQEVSRLQKAVPDAVFHYVFELFGQTVSTSDEEIIYKNKKLGDSYEDELRAALDILKGCHRLVLENCRFSNDLLVQLREEYRYSTKIVWRVNFAARGSTLTDRTVLRYVYNLSDSNCSNLQYCEDAEYIDFGHNETLSNCQWVSNMRNLKAIILSGSMIKTLDGFENCESLQFLELGYCGYIEDLSPLASCTNLTMLNISYTKVSDLSPLDNLNIQTLVGVSSLVSEEELARFQELHPDCVVSFDHGANLYGYPWRYESDMQTLTPMYATLKEKFGYPNATDTLW